MSARSTSGRFAGRAVYVLGAGTAGEESAIGNGRAIAMRVADEGATVAVVDKRLDAAEATLRRCRHGGTAIRADVADPADCLAAVAEAERELGRLDAIVCSVGVDVLGRPPLHELELEDWQRINDINVRSHWLTVKAALPAMLAHGRGAFVFVGSTAGLTGSRAYGVTKAALIGLMRGVATEYGSRGVRANLVAPGVIDTPMLRRDYGEPGDSADIRRRFLPLGREGSPDEVAGAVAFLASEDSGYVNGQVLAVDGGLTTRSFLALDADGAAALGLAPVEGAPGQRR